MPVINIAITELTATDHLPSTLQLTISQCCTSDLYEQIELPINLAIKDLTDPITLEFSIGSKSFCKSRIYLLGLLTAEQFSVVLYKDLNSDSYSDVFPACENWISIGFVRVSEDIQSFFTEIKAEQNTRLEGKKDFMGGIDMNRVLGLENAEKNQKYLENLVVGLNSKFKAIERKHLMQEEAMTLASEFARTTEKAQNFKENNSFSEVFLMRQKVKAKKSEDATGLRNQIDSLTAENKILSGNKSLNEAEEAKIKNLLAEIQRLQSNLDLSEKSRISLRSEQENMAKTFENSIISLESALKSLSDENSALTSQLIAQTSKVSELEQLTSELSSTNASLLSGTQALTLKILGFSHLESLYNEATSRKNPDFSNLPPELSQSATMSLSEQNSFLLNKLQDSQSEKDALKEQVKNQENIINLITINNMNNSTLNKLESLADPFQSFPALSAEIDLISQWSTALQEKIYAETGKILKNFSRFFQRHLNLQRLVQKILRSMFDKDCEIYLLRNLALDAQRDKKSYLPVRTDPIDVCMAEFLNSRSPPLPIPVVREDQGVYLFASRTIKVKTENNKIIVRLGGGFESIECFVTGNVQAEVDKIEERRKFGAADAMKAMIDQDLTGFNIPQLFESKNNVESLSASSSFVSTNASPAKLKRKPTGKEPAKAISRKKTIS